MSEFQQSEQPQSPESNAEQTRYRDAAAAFVEHFDTLDDASRAEAMDQFVQRIFNEAGEGAVKSSHGDTYTPDKLREQLEDFATLTRTPDEAMPREELDRIQALSERVNGNPAMFIPKSGGMREAFSLLGESGEPGAALAEAIDRERFAHEKAAQDLGEEAVDEVVATQPLAENDAAAAAKRIVEAPAEQSAVDQVNDIENEYDALVRGDAPQGSVEGAARGAGMTDQEAAIVQRYYDHAKQEQERFQKEGKGEDAQYWGGVAGQYAQDLIKHGRQPRY